MRTITTNDACIHSVHIAIVPPPQIGVANEVEQFFGVDKFRLVGSVMD
jgi:hypothetical protein